MPIERNNRSPEERREAMESAHRNYLPILAMEDTEVGKKLGTCDKNLEFPEAPKDILEYLGNSEPLELTEDEKQNLRRSTAHLIEQQSARWIWDNRYRLKLEILYLKNF